MLSGCRSVEHSSSFLENACFKLHFPHSPLLEEWLLKCDKAGELLHQPGDHGVCPPGAECSVRHLLQIRLEANWTDLDVTMVNDQHGTLQRRRAALYTLCMQHR